LPTTLSLDAATDPNGYLDQLYQELPRLFAHGGTQERVDAVFGGIDIALARALGTPHGVTIGLRLFARPWGWAPDIVEPIAVHALIAAGASAGFDDADFSAGDLCGRIFVPADAGRWQRWNPTSGPAPVPVDGHLRVVVAFRRRDIKGVTVCHIREVFGRDQSLADPLYKPALQLAPASSTEAAHLMNTLRALLTTEEAA
jgi:hypothetical protein